MIFSTRRLVMLGLAGGSVVTAAVTFSLIAHHSQSRDKARVTRLTRPSAPSTTAEIAVVDEGKDDHTTTAIKPDDESMVNQAKQVAAAFLKQRHTQTFRDDPAQLVEQLQPLATPELMSRLRTNSSAAAERQRMRLRHEVRTVELPEYGLLLDGLSVDRKTVRLTAYPVIIVTFDGGQQRVTLTVMMVIVNTADGWRVQRAVP